MTFSRRKQLSWNLLRGILALVFLGTLLCCSGPQPRTPATALEDDLIRAEVIRRINSEPSLRGATISVETNEGVVTLRGVAQDAIDRHLAESLAKGVDGVVEVINFLEVKRQGRPFFLRRR
ncbi:MAG: BON domain-containing protein [Thermodesulfobacteriota bacterium]